MFDPGSLDLSSLMAQAQALQDQLERAQAELADQRITGSSGGGLVEATVSGTGELLELTISPDVVDPSDTETLADLIVAAVRDASHKATALAQAAMPPMPELGL
ncbi:MAG: YbaB/EbfC family nucleoid-associated protein [Actinobacteria bacterium]|nr:YbaB/EbfC family nucleoid-associated protein [Actinomycetota bacterium]